MKILYVFLSLIFITSCSVKPEIDCTRMVAIVEKDQYFRKKHKNLLSPYFHVLDSIYKVHGHPDGINILSQYPGNLRDEMAAISREIIDNREPVPDHIIDSIYQLQRDYDNENIEEVLGLIETVGLSKMDSLGNGCAMETLLVFVHATEEHYARIRKAIDPELLKYNEERYNHIMWNLDGRK